VSIKQTSLSEDFIHKIAGFSAGYLPTETIDSFITLINEEIPLHYFTFSSESNLLRIISAMFDKISFMNESIRYPYYIEILLLISVNSNYLTDILVRNPEYFYWIINLSNLNRKPDPETWNLEINNLLTQYNSISAKVNALRRFKRKEILRIGLNDLLGLNNLKEITHELSILANGLISALFETCYKEVLTKYGIKKIANHYCIVALGKLGGDELNYSSDVDLIVFFDRNSVIKKKEYFEIINEAIYLFIENSVSITSSGFIYRVDFRLRPDGRNSPLCRTITDYMLYYESRGEDWERQMLLKAGFAGGSKDLYDRFMIYLQPFIYPLGFSVSPTEQIAKLKSNIEKNNGSDENIKLSPGGIRDIEFSVQALQLLNGGRIKEIRTGNTLEAIQYLNKNNLLGNEETEIFDNAYILFRKTEHFLQLMNDKQTHLIPGPGELLEKLASWLGYKSVNEFRNDLSIKQAEVKNIFNSIMGVLGEKEKVLNKIKFFNPQRSGSDLLFLREGKGILGQRQFDKNSIESFQKIEPVLLDYLETSLRPDKVLQNFVRVIKNISFPSQWYREFSDIRFFQLFLNLCGMSQKTIDLFAEDAELREHFISKGINEKPLIDSFSFYPMKKVLYILSALFTSEKINSVQTGKLLTESINNKIQELSDKMLPEDAEYIIAGLGSYGTGEMNFSSDADLIFIVNNINESPDSHKKFLTLLTEIKRGVKPMEADCRLRPEGRSSQLVWDFRAYENYIMNRARIWELQSLCKLRFVSGNKKLFNKFVKAIITRLEKENPEQLKKEINEMRRKLTPSGTMEHMNIINLKKDRGGLLDIEFIIQLLIICSPELFRKTLNYATEKKIALLFPDDPDVLKNYIFLKDLVIRNQCIFNSSGYLFKEDEKENLIYRNELRRVMRSNRNLFIKTIGK
jgi:glutamate-ammonia-ligase adenylyltransferase